MRYRKLSLLLVISLVMLLLISLGLIITWVYYFYDENNQEGKAVLPARDSVALVSRQRDSLKHVYASTLNGLRNPVDSIWNKEFTPKDSIDSKLAEFDRLRQEISILLQRSTSNTELDTARTKIAFLQRTIEDLRNRTLAIEQENKRLNEVVQKLSTRLGKQEGPVATEHPDKRAIKMGNTSANTAVASSGFTTSDLRLTAYKSLDGSQEETEEAGLANMLRGSFTLRNNDAEDYHGEVYVVVQQPDGKPLINSAWESGSFDSKDGKKVYSARIPFDYSAGEQKHLSFSINTEDLFIGGYSMLVYHNGIVIGKTSRTLK
jgi:hypothetical protein